MFPKLSAVLPALVFAALLFAVPARAEELTVPQAVAAGLPQVLPTGNPRGDVDCACVVLDYGDKGTVKITAAEVTQLKRVTGATPALVVVAGGKPFTIAGGLCERVALLSLSVAQWLDKPLDVVDASGKPSNAGCNAIPTK